MANKLFGPPETFMVPVVGDLSVCLFSWMAMFIIVKCFIRGCGLVTYGGRCLPFSPSKTMLFSLSSVLG